jgi:hypothetical protein
MHKLYIARKEHIDRAHVINLIDLVSIVLATS